MHRMSNKDSKRSLVFNETLCINTHMKWNEKAKRLMKIKKIRQEDLIKVLGVQTRGAVGHYLSGRRQPSPAQMKALADKLGCTLDELMFNGETDIMQLKVSKIIRAAEKAMATSTHEFTEEERMSVYRVAFAAGLDMAVTDEQLDAYLYGFVKK